MTASLNRERLVRLPSILGNEHDGEAVTAARHTDALIGRSGLTGRDVVASNEGQPQLDYVGFGVAMRSSLVSYIAIG